MKLIYYRASDAKAWTFDRTIDRLYMSLWPVFLHYFSKEADEEIHISETSLKYYSEEQECFWRGSRKDFKRVWGKPEDVDGLDFWWVTWIFRNIWLSTVKNWQRIKIFFLMLQIIPIGILLLLLYVTASKNVKEQMDIIQGGGNE